MRLWLCLLLGLSWFGNVAVAEELKPLPIGSPAPPFALEDAEQKLHKLKDLRTAGKTVLLILGNRHLRKEDNLWAKWVRKQFDKDKRLVTFIVADMRSVPRFIPRFLIRSQLRRNPPPTTLLLDWKGEVHQRYRTRSDKPTLCLIAPSGKVAYFAWATPTDEARKALREALEQVLSSTKTHR